MLLHPLQSEWDAGLLGGDPLGFPGYVPPERESVLTGRTRDYALIQGRFDVVGGSMGAAHGERVVRAYRRAAGERLPVVVVSASGGARMQEGMVALVQLARTAAAARDHAAAGLLQVAVLRGPTTGGVYASYASLADVRAAEPGATIGFAGPRVVELTTGERVPDDSHTAESAWRAGLVDALVRRDDQAAWVETALGLPGHAAAPPASAGGWVAALCSSWTPLHSDDPCISAGLATCASMRMVVVTMNGSRPGPAGYRLAQRAAALAGRLGLPLLTLVDTPGADPSPASEAGGVAGEIARTFAALDALPTRSVAVCVGTGGSGGALALAHTDRLLMMERSTFSVIAPEGAAAILDRTTDTAEARAADLRITAVDMLELGIADEVVSASSGALLDAVSRAFTAARPGDRRRRWDAATAPWLR